MINTENLFTLNLGSEYFDAIKNGSKTMEGRILDQKRKDIIQCYNNYYYNYNDNNYNDNNDNDNNNNITNITNNNNNNNSNSADDRNVYIKFICTDTTNIMILQLKGYIVYPSFLDATKLHYKEMIPWANTPEEAAQVYKQWFTKEDEEQYGIVLLLV